MKCMCPSVWTRCMGVGHTQSLRAPSSEGPVLGFILCSWNLNKGPCILILLWTGKLYNQPSFWTPEVNLTMLCFCSNGYHPHCCSDLLLCIFTPTREGALESQRSPLLCSHNTWESSFHGVKTLMRRQEDCLEFFRKEWIKATSTENKGKKFCRLECTNHLCFVLLEGNPI